MWIAVDDGGSVNGPGPPIPIPIPSGASPEGLNGVGGAVGHGHQPLLAQHGISQELRHDLAALQVALPQTPRLVRASPAGGPIPQSTLQVAEHGLREHFLHLHVLHTLMTETERQI